jgi:hypothetical protein
VRAEGKDLQIVKAPRIGPSQEALYREKVALLASLHLHRDGGDADGQIVALTEGHVGLLLERAKEVAARKVVVREGNLQAKGTRETSAGSQGRALQQVTNLLQGRQERHAQSEGFAIREEQSEIGFGIEAREEHG